jgi:carbon-monoxide dehydrogenase large subunit
LRGRGIGQYLEVTAPPQKEMGGLRFEEDGTVTIITGTLDYGQGHATPFAQVLVDRLGIPFDRIRLFQGDSDELIAGGGTGGSKSMMASGAAIVEASEILIEKGRTLAADVLEAAPADIEFSIEPSGGRFRIAGTDRGIGIMELAAHLRETGAKETLDVKHIHDQAPSAFPNGCHVAEVEVDPETGLWRLDSYMMLHDFGRVLNPMLLQGQLQGGIAQGIGQAFCERVVHDADGQVLTGSFMDYQIPRADDLPDLVLQTRPTPSPVHPLGVKGCGEAGAAGACPAVMNALLDALWPKGVRRIDMPATPEAVWRALSMSSA